MISEYGTIVESIAKVKIASRSLRSVLVLRKVRSLAMTAKGV
jgi:hypothetical protein